MATESDVDSAIIMQLSGLGWRPDPRNAGRNVFRQSPKTDEERAKLGRLRPDYILYADPNSGRATVVIEAKKPNKTLAAALDQGRRYAELLGAPIVVATDGYRLKTWHLVKGAPLFFNAIEVEELFGPEMALRFAPNNIYENFSRNERVGKRDLIKKFKSAHRILRSEGLEAGIVRFSEFANLMFLKLSLEGGGDIGGHTWDDIENKRGHAQLAAVKSIFAHLRRERSSLFEQTRIQHPENLEKLIDILSSFRLAGVRDDIKGMAFEHFIHSYTQGMTNDLGQYFTPRHIVKMMVHYLRPRLGEKIYDPFCGTGGMLIECFRYIQHGVASAADWRLLRQATIYGRDISSVARIAMMNMIMFGDGHSNVEQGDSYRRPNNGQYDIVVTNIPFSQTTDHTEGYPVPPESAAKNGDSIGVQHCLTGLKPGGDARAAIIVPIGFLYKKELRREREHIARNFHLDRVVELTPKCFNPYTEQQTAVLMLRRRRQPAGPAMYYRVKNDGFSQDGYRVPMPGDNDIDRVMEDENGRPTEIGAADGWKYKKISAPLRRGEKRLAELAAIRAGSAISPKTTPRYTVGGRFPIVMVADLAAAHVDYCLDESGKRINDLAVAEKRPHLHPANTIVIPTSGKAALLNHRALLAAPAYLSATVAGIAAKEGVVHPYYLFYWLLRWDAEDSTYDLGYPGLSASVLGDIAIPMLNAGEQERIVAAIADTVEAQKIFKARHRRLIAGDAAEGDSAA